MATHCIFGLSILAAAGTWARTFVRIVGELTSRREIVSGGDDIPNEVEEDVEQNDIDVVEGAGQGVEAEEIDTGGDALLSSLASLRID